MLETLYELRKEIKGGEIEVKTFQGKSQTKLPISPALEFIVQNCATQSFLLT